jgi:predicted nucleic acid-binding protein
MTLVDTSVWIDFFLARKTRHVAMLESLIEQSEDLCLCGVILTEVLQGIRDDHQYKMTEAILSNLIFLPMNRNTFLSAANIYRFLRSQGITIRNSLDCMIAAACIEHDAQLLHKDRDFDHIANLFDLRVVVSHNAQ